MMKCNGMFFDTVDTSKWVKIIKDKKISYKCYYDEWDSKRYSFLNSFSHDTVRRRLGLTRNWFDLEYVPAKNWPWDELYVIAYAAGLMEKEVFTDEEFERIFV